MTVGICIPVAGSAAELERTLTSVRRARRGTEAFVVVAVDGPDSALATTAEAGADSVVVLPENRGSYAARNAAVDALAQDVSMVLFTDSGVEVAESWITAHVAALEMYDRSGGPVVCVTRTPPSAAEWVDAHRHFRQRENVTQLGFSVTANLGVRRAVLQRVRFDGGLRSGGDFEFGRRASNAGFSIGWAEDAVVRHPARRSVRALVAKVDRVGRGSAELRRRGHRPSARRVEGRASALAAARAAGIAPNARWLVNVMAIDALCSVAFARHQPTTAIHGVARRIRRFFRVTGRRPA